MAADWNTAYNAMRKHASDQIDAKPAWGATKELVTNNMYEVIDRNHAVLLRYDIATIGFNGKDANDAPIWTRERELTENAKVQPIHYGMYVDVHCEDETKKETFFAGGYKSLGEASHAMKTSAYAYLAAHSGATMLERSVELVDEKGEIKQRYNIENGRWKAKAFLKEQDWLTKDMDVQTGIPLSLPHTTGSGVVLREPMMRLPNHRINAGTTPPIPQQAASVPRPQLQVQAQYASPEPEPVAQTLSDNRELWCTCDLPDDGYLMLLCDNEDCPIQWYHGACVGVSKAEALTEEEKWWCPTCAPTHGRKKGPAKKKAKGKGKGRRKTG